jgi:pimeloyl-ACP methyl ester carboxylesterase
LQILYAITSSPIAWTGNAAGRFSLVGFSMGGSIVMDFFAHYPQLVQSIVLLGPGGLVRDLPLEYKSLWFQYPSMVSQATMRCLLGTLLGVEMARSKEVRPAKEGFTPAGALQFQFDHHDGHLLSFLSTLQHGPLQHQEAVWERAGNIIKGAESHDTLLSGGKILAICGESDPVVPPEDVRDDLVKFMGPAHFELATVPGGHGFPWTEGKAIAAYISEFWGLRSEEEGQFKL